MKMEKASERTYLELFVLSIQIGRFVIGQTDAVDGEGCRHTAGSGTAVVLVS